MKLSRLNVEILSVRYNEIKDYELCITLQIDNKEYTYKEFIPEDDFRTFFERCMDKAKFVLLNNIVKIEECK